MPICATAAGSRDRHQESSLQDLLIRFSSLVAHPTAVSRPCLLKGCLDGILDFLQLGLRINVAITILDSNTHTVIDLSYTVLHLSHTDVHLSYTHTHRHTPVVHTHTHRHTPVVHTRTQRHTPVVHTHTHTHTDIHLSYTHTHTDIHLSYTHTHTDIHLSYTHTQTYTCHTHTHRHTHGLVFYHPVVGSLDLLPAVSITTIAHGTALPRSMLHLKPS